MGVLDDAIREHLDLKRRRGASAEEIARAEAEALGPARRSVDQSADDDELGPDPLDRLDDPDLDEPPATRILQSDDSDLPARSFPTRAVHDIDEDPLAPPPPVERARFADEPHAPPAADEPLEPPFDDDPAKPPPAGDDDDVGDHGRD